MTLSDIQVHSFRWDPSLHQRQIVWSSAKHAAVHGSGSHLHGLHHRMKQRGIRILQWTARLGVSLWVTSIFFCSPGVNGYERAEFPDMVYGRAWRPFVTRALFPAVVRAVSAAIPPGFDSSVQSTEWGARILASDFMQHSFKWRPPFLREYLVAFLLTLACVVALSITMERLWETMFLPSRPHAFLFGTLGVLGLPVCFKYYSYIYDFPTLLLYSVCLLMLARRRLRWYVLLFALASFSKETSVLLIVVFAAYFVRIPKADRRAYRGFIAIQITLFVTIRAAVEYVFRGNPGSIFEFHLIDHNLHLLAMPWSLESFIAWGLLIALVFHQYTRKPWLLRVAAAMIVPLLALMLFFGYLDELRDCYEAYVPIAALVGCSVSTLLGSRTEIIAPASASEVCL